MNEHILTKLCLVTNMHLYINPKRGFKKILAPSKLSRSSGPWINANMHHLIYFFIRVHSRLDLKIYHNIVRNSEISGVYFVSASARLMMDKPREYRSLTST